MYLPRIFEEGSRERLFELVDAHPFATLVAVAPSGEPEIAHAPVLLDRDALGGARLVGHVARANPLASLVAAGARVTAVFHGPHGYVSPRWYGAPREQVPTWNYVVVHVEGTSRALAQDELRVELDRLARRFEANADDPWELDDLAPSFVDDLARGIVGFTIAIERLRGKAKLSQNRSSEDHARVIDALEARGGADDHAMAAWMRASRERS